MVEKLTPKERHVIEHALGWPKDYRNHFTTEPGTDDWPVLVGLVERGLMRGPANYPLAKGLHTFVVTDAGRTALQCPERPDACPSCDSGDVTAAFRLPPGTWKCQACGAVWRGDHRKVKP